MRSDPRDRCAAHESTALTAVLGVPNPHVATATLRFGTPVRDHAHGTLVLSREPERIFQA